MFTLISNLIVSQAEATTQTADKVLARVDKAGEFLSTSLTALAQKLGVTVEYLWPTFIKEQMCSGVGLLLGGTVAIVLGIFVLILLRKDAIKRFDNSSYALGVFLFAVCTAIGIALLTNGLTHIIAPEPAALRAIGEIMSGNLH